MEINVQDVVMARLAEHSWVADRIIKTVAIRDFKLPSNAVARLTRDSSQPQYWLRGEFHSAGESVLATCHAIIPVNATKTEIEAKVDQFSAEAERRIAASFAGRFLRKD